MSWAKPKYTNETFKSVKTLKEGTTVFRILPPIHSLEIKGLWSQSHSQHFGYTVLSNDKSKEVPRTFYCVEQYDYATKKVIRECPECRKIQDTKETLEDTRRELKRDQRSEKAIADRVEPLVEWLKRHNLDRKVYINVLFADGTVGTLKIGWKTKKEMDRLINSLKNPEDVRTKPIDPIDADQGVWFEVVRSGKGLTTEYSVSVVTETLDVDVGGETVQVRKVKLAPLSEDIYQKALQDCFDLSDVGIRRLPFDRVVALVNGPGDPESVEAIFSTAEKERSPSAEKSPSPVSAAPVSPSPVPVTPPPPKVVVKQDPAPVQETKASVDPESMSDEEFRRFFGK